MFGQIVMIIITAMRLLKKWFLDYPNMEMMLPYVDVHIIGCLKIV